MTSPFRTFARSLRAGRRCVVAGLLTGSLLVAGAPTGHAAIAGSPALSPAPLTPIADTVPGIVTAHRAAAIGAAASTMPLQLAIGLQGRDPAGLQRFLTAVSDPASPAYRQYLTPAQFDQRFGPDPAAVAAVTAFLRGAGLAAGTVYGAGALIDVATTVAQAQQAFHTQISMFRRADGRTFYAPVTNPQLPSAIAGYVTGIAGLDNAAPLRPRFVRRPSGAPRAGSAPRSGPPSRSGGLTPSQVRTAYDVTPLLNRGLNGSGRTIDLFELDGWTPSNITTFDHYYGLPSPAPRGISIDGAAITSGDGFIGEDEVELDIEVVQSIAPAAHINVYVAPNSSSAVLDLDHAIAQAHDASVVSSSWGDCEPDTTLSYATMEEAAFEQMVAEGMDFFNASGDSGSQECASIDGDTAYAAATEGDDPYVTAVGGTSLTLRSDDSYASETVWEGASGGGTTTFFARPSYQQSPGVINSYSNGKREYPDVSADGDPNTGYDIYAAGGWGEYGGTSAAAPLWAALVELFDEDAISRGQAPYGFINPALYTLAAGSPALPPFHDITVGDNDPGVPKHNPVFFPATPRYDLATGIGSPNANNLVQDLRPASGGTTAALSAQSGWNLVGLPLASSATINASAVLGAILRSGHGHLAAIYKLSGGRWSSPALDKGGQISGDFALGAGAGYLLYTDAAGSYTEAGAVPASPAGWSLRAGWNVVGLTRSAAGSPMASAVLGAILRSGHGHLAALYKLSGGRWSSPALDKGGQISGDFALAAGAGYLLYTDAAAAITPAPAPSSPGATGAASATSGSPPLPAVPAEAATGA